ncbi:dCTP deaminase domain-containing protein [Clostridium diolis]|uniref:dCTP deaminase domain-containing protein n=1 Tax=Clostridium diolis TaxID=223919 RepID=UPI0015C67C87|nr:hypothetical protein [Clostridium diolis]
MLTYVSLFLFRGALSDKDIKRLLGYHIFIYPFNKENLKASSYNLTASKFAFVKVKENGEEKQKLIVKDGNIIIPKGKTGIIETRESIYVSKWITGTYHSKVKLVNRGLGHIGTTLDPCYFGVSAIALHNTTDEDIPIKVGDTIATMMFYSLKSRSSGMHDNMTARIDDGINLDTKDFYDFEEQKKKSTIIFMEDLENEINGETIRKITEDDKMYSEKNKIIIYDVEKPECENCKNCKEKDSCSYKLLKIVISEVEKRARIIREIKEWRSQSYILSKEALIEKVREKVKKDNTNLDIFLYSILILLIAITLICIMIWMGNKYDGLKQTCTTIIGVSIPTAVVSIGIIANYKSKYKGED